MRLLTWTVAALQFGSSTAAVGAVGPLDQTLPSVSRDSLRMNRVRRSDLTHRVNGSGVTRYPEGAAGMEVILPLDARRASNVMVGQQAVVGLGRGLHRGKVARVRAVSGEDFEVAVTLDRSPGPMCAGQPAVASIITGRTRDTLVIEGVRGLAPGSTVSWFKMDAQNPGTATRIAVQIGVIVSNRVEVSSYHLSAGDTVVTLGLELLPSGVDRVRIR